jgi:hypothetical protein
LGERASYWMVGGPTSTSLTVEKAIDNPDQVGKVERQLGKARRRAAREGTPQPRIRPDLEAPQEEAAY